MVPVVSLLAFWAYATVATVQDVAAQRNFQDVNATVLTPLREYIGAVQAERTVGAEHLGGSAAAQDAVSSAASATMSAAMTLNSGITVTRTEAAELDPGLPPTMDALVESVAAIGALREGVVARDIGLDEAYAGYTAAIESAFRLQGALSEVPVPEDESSPRIVHELAYGREMLARADAIMAGAAAAGTMSAGQYADLAGAATASEAFFTALPELRPSDAAAYQQVLDSEAYATLRSYREAIVAAGPGDAPLSAVPGEDWSEVADVVLADLAAAEAVATSHAAEPTGFFGPDVLGTAGLAVALGLVGVILSLMISVYIGRGLLVELVGLRNTAMDLAARKLPNALRRLHAGEKVNLETEAPRAAYGVDEVSQVAEALNAVHRAAITAAIERSHVLSGISGVYVYLARRSQVLLHRQLALLDAMERRTEDPQDLEDLFRLDHLTTRMRRQAESLIILSGANPARRWRYPVPAVDIVRAAVAEVEDFTRVELHDLPDIRVIGASVADLTHLIAELVENAVTFSPPHTKALIRGELVGAGLAIEIEDRGLGMSRQVLADANRRMSDEGQVDLLEADQLGLFVVNRLAHRQNVKASLQRSPYGGVTAVVLIPGPLLDRSPAPADLVVSSGPDEQLREPRPAPQIRDSPWQVITSDTPDGTVPGGHAAGNGEVKRPAISPVLASRGGHETRPIAQPSPDAAERNGAGHTGGEVDAVDAVDDGEDGEDLPRRVRQANLAPELRDAAQQDADPPADTGQGRTPEEARATLAALRTGWQRGQTESDERGDDT
jgi:hypothetical protein